MSVITLNLEPDSRLLDSNFDGYKLVLSPVSTTRKEFATAVDKVLLDVNTYSLLKAKVLCAHNHLFGDPFDEFNSVYYVDQALNIQKTYLDSLTNELIDPVSVFCIPRVGQPRSGDYNVTLVFASSEHAVVSDGKGMLYILLTRDKRDDDNFEILFSGNVLEKENQGFFVKDALYNKDRQELHVLLLYIEETEEEGSFCVIHWVSFKQIQNTWGQSALRRLKTKGETSYLCFEENCDFIYVVSESEVMFELNSEFPVARAPAGDPSAPARVYTWSQTDEDLNIKINLEKNARKELVQFTVENTTLNVGYDQNVLIEGALWDKIEAELATWTLERGVLEIVLTKSKNEFWPELIPGNTQGEYISCLSSNQNQSGDAVPQDGIPFSLEQVEESDTEYRNVKFERISGTTNLPTHQIFLGKHISISLHLTPDRCPAFAARHNLDLCVWQPMLDNGEFKIKHEGTLLSLNYIEGSQANKTYITCSPNLNYATISDSFGHVFVYHQNKPIISTELRQRTTGQRVLKNSQQQVVHVPNNDFLGLRANNTHVFILGKNFIMAAAVNV